MQYPIMTTLEDIQAFEEDTGFFGIGERMIRAGLWKIVEEKCASNVMVPSLIPRARQSEKGTPVPSFQA